MAVNAPVEIDRTRIRELTEREGTKLDERTGGSRAMYERARRSLSGGVASSYQVREPWPIYLTHGEGQRVWDVDGSEYLDFHNGFGSMTQGHAHPVITRAIAERAALGTHFAAATEDGIAVAEELARRFRLPKWRYTNSGSEATMDAIRIARGLTGRETIVKIFGSYHGHHDAVMVSIGVEYGRFGAGLTLAGIVSRRAAGARSSTRRSEDALSRTGWAGAGAGAGAAGSTGAGMTATDVSPGAAALDVGGGTVAGAGSAEVSRVARYGIVPPACETINRSPGWRSSVPLKSRWATMRVVSNVNSYSDGGSPNCG